MAMDNRILDDLAKVAAGALGGVTGVRQEIEARLRQQFERVLANMEVVSREEFEVVRRGWEIRPRRRADIELSPIRKNSAIARGLGIWQAKSGG
jgi:BMFP domain-containing protein YqiC